MTHRLRAPAALVLLLVGAAAGVCSVFVHHGDVGLALAVAATASASYALPGGWWARLPFGLGWVGAVGFLLQTRPEGDYLISSDAHGYTLLGFGLLLLLFSIVTIRPLRPDPPARIHEEPTDAS